MQVERRKEYQSTIKPDSNKQNPIQSPKDKPIIDNKDNPINDRNKNEGVTDREHQKYPRNQQTKNKEDILTQKDKSAKGFESDAQNFDNTRDKHKKKGENYEKIDRNSSGQNKMDTVDYSNLSSVRNNIKNDNNEPRDQNTDDNDNNDFTSDNSKVKTHSEKTGTEFDKFQKNRQNIEDIKKYDTNQSNNQWADQRTNSNESKGDNKSIYDNSHNSRKILGGYKTPINRNNLVDQSNETSNLNPDNKNQNFYQDNDKTRLEKNIEEENRSNGSHFEKAKDVLDDVKEKIKDTFQTSPDKSDMNSSSANNNIIIDQPNMPYIEPMIFVDESPVVNSTENASHTIENVKDLTKQGRQALNYMENDKNKPLDDVINKKSRLDNPSQSQNILERESHIFDNANQANDLNSRNHVKGHHDNLEVNPYQKYDINERNVSEMIENDKDDLSEVSKSSDTGFRSTQGQIKNMGVTSESRNNTRGSETGGEGGNKGIGQQISDKINNLMNYKF